MWSRVLASDTPVMGSVGERRFRDAGSRGLPSRKSQFQSVRSEPPQQGHGVSVCLVTCLPSGQNSTAKIYKTKQNNSIVVLTIKAHLRLTTHILVHEPLQVCSLPRARPYCVCAPWSRSSSHVHNINRPFHSNPELSLELRRCFRVRYVLRAFGGVLRERKRLGEFQRGLHAPLHRHVRLHLLPHRGGYGPPQQRILPARVEGTGYRKHDC